jgi:hypothetical protein
MHTAAEIKSPPHSAYEDRAAQSASFDTLSRHTPRPQSPHFAALLKQDTVILKAGHHEVEP